MSEFPIALRRPLIPNGCRRAPWHDYRSRSIYMITINAAKGIPPFSHISGIPGSHEYKPKCINTHLGEIIAKHLSRIKDNFPFVSILRRVIMPEHIHFVIFVKESGICHLGDIIRKFKADCTREASGYSSPKTNDTGNKLPSVFEEDYHDRILLKDGQLKKILDYVSDNPRRRLLRMMHPDYNMRHPVADELKNEYEAYGNLSLLTDPDIEAVKISSRYTAEELRQRKLNWKRTVENCGVLASPFISESEKKVKQWAIENGGRLILIETNGFSPRFSPKGILHDICCEGRLLIIAPKTHQTTKQPLTRRQCDSMNALALSIAEGKVKVINRKPTVLL